MKAYISASANTFFPIGTPVTSQSPPTVPGGREPWVVCPGAGWRPWGYFTTHQDKADMAQA